MHQGDYFEGYGNLVVHRAMLMDKVRVNSYWNTINQNRHLIEGKTVLDVGAGTGILSVYCAKVGAKKVYAVEACKQLIELLENVIKENECESIIEIIQDDVETIDLHEKVDIIISEWMGHCLLLEGMLNSIISARRLLKSDGILIPNRANFYAALCDIPPIARDWSVIKGVNLLSVVAEYRAEIAQSPLISEVKFSDLLSPYKKFYSLDLTKIEEKDIKTLEASVIFECNQDGMVEGLCIWWDVELMNDITISTSPESPMTHWKQTTILFQKPFVVDAGCKIKTKILMQQVARRKFEIEICLEN